MDFEVEIDNEEQFWEGKSLTSPCVAQVPNGALAELDDIVSTPCRTHERIDDTLRTWLAFSAAYREQYLASEQSINRCSSALLSSNLFSKNQAYIRRQLVACLLQEDDTLLLHLVAAFLLWDGRSHDEVYELLNNESAFPCVVRLVQEGADDDHGLHRLLLELLYEMSRTQQLSWNDLTTVDDTFIIYILQIIESLANDVCDPYHAPSIRVLLILNEQYMISSQTSSDQPTNLTNRVVKAISLHGRKYKTFGENVILLLNRESESSLQLLILKLLYLLFTTPSTQEYFYTNDLHVLTDIITRNLLDLPSSTSNPAAGPLKHTYLRVLHPLITNTQMKLPPHSKKDQLRRVLNILGNTDDHFDAPDATTLRLVARCLTTEWLYDGDFELQSVTALQEQSTGGSGAGSMLLANRAIGIEDPPSNSSSMVDMATQRAKPGVLAPSIERESLS